jgi:hypothetical protein
MDAGSKGICQAQSASRPRAKGIHDGLWLSSCDPRRIVPVWAPPCGRYPGIFIVL